MVNTKKTKQTSAIDNSEVELEQASNQRRSTRRGSVDSNAVMTSSDLPLTPLRRSRRLSGSSVESATNDSPLPIAKLARRSIRSKATASGSDVEDSDIQHQVKKRRKGEAIETLTIIDEENGELETTNGMSAKAIELVDLDQEGKKAEEVVDITSDHEDTSTETGLTNDKENTLVETVEATERVSSVASSNDEKTNQDPAGAEKDSDKAEEAEETKKETESAQAPKTVMEVILRNNPLLPEEPKKIPKASEKTVKNVEPDQKKELCGAEIMRNIPRGRPRSGRLWKDPKTNPRYMYKDKGLKMPHEKINQLRQERMRVKLLENRLKEEERARREDLKKRREINKQRMEANARKGEIVQVIRNTAKLKRMSKKQLRLIQKRDTSAME